MSSSEQTILIGGYDYAPFMSKSTQSGIYHDLMEAISTHTKQTYQWKYYPYARLDKFFELGNIHIEVGSSPDWSSTSLVPGEYTRFFYSLEDVAVFQPGLAFDINHPSDIKGKTISVVRGYGYPKYDPIFLSKQAKRFDAADESQLLNMLDSGRFDAIFINKNVFRHFQMQNVQFQNLTMGDVIGRYDVGIRVHPNHTHLIKPLNQAIKALKENGIIDKIAERYMFKN